MSKKDFELIARVIRSETETARGNYETSSVLALRDTAIRFATELAAGNPRFDRARFLTACGHPVQ